MSQFTVTIPPEVRLTLGDEASDDLQEEINRVLENLAVRISSETRDKMMPEIQLAFERFGRTLDERLNDRFDRVNARFDRIDERFDQMRNHVDERFSRADERANERFDAMDQRVNERFDSLAVQIEGVRLHVGEKVGNALDKMRDHVTESRLGHLHQFYKLVVGSAIFVTAVALASSTIPLVLKLVFKL